VLRGYQAPNDAVVRAALLLRAGGGPDALLATVDAAVQAGPDGGDHTTLARGLDVAAAPAACGGLLVLRLSALSASADFLELEARLTLP
jgi:hypothetical protein